MNGYQKYFDNQIASASVVFLNRTGSLDDEGRLALMEIIERINPAIRVVAEPYGAADIWEALDAPPDVPDAAVQRLPKSWLASFRQLSVDTGWNGSKERLESFMRPSRRSATSSGQRDLCATLVARAFVQSWQAECGHSRLRTAAGRTACSSSAGIWLSIYKSNSSARNQCDLPSFPL